MLVWKVRDEIRDCLFPQTLRHNKSTSIVHFVLAELRAIYPVSLFGHRTKLLPLPQLKLLLHEFGLKLVPASNLGVNLFFERVNHLVGRLGRTAFAMNQHPVHACQLWFIALILWPCYELWCNLAENCMKSLNPGEANWPVFDQQESENRKGSTHLCVGRSRSQWRVFRLAASSKYVG